MRISHFFGYSKYRRSTSQYRWDTWRCTIGGQPWPKRPTSRYETVEEPGVRPEIRWPAAFNHRTPPPSSPANARRGTHARYAAIIRFAGQPAQLPNVTSSSLNA
nr:unnamed protein product [Digitaria exilis]